MMQTNDARGLRARPSLEAPLDRATAALLEFAALVVEGQADRLEAAAARLGPEGVPAAWVDELLLQSVLMAGWPRALVAAGAWRRCGGAPAPPEESLGPMDLDRWTARGIETCRTIYGANYERLRRNVKTLHPALDRWMITEGYGRTLSRPGLDLARRELCTVVQMAVLDAPHQLHSHLRGALHAGASAAAVHEAVGVGVRRVPAERAATVRDLWREVRDRWERSA